MQVDTERQPLNKENINSDSHHVTSDEVDHAAIKRKKYIKWGIIGALIIIALILVITLPIVLTKKDDNPSPGPAPGPTPGPPGGDKYNPYNVDPEKIVYDQVSLSGVLEVPSDLQQTANPEFLAQKFFKLNEGSQDDPPKPTDDHLNVDWKKLRIDNNNKFSYKLKFQFDMIDYTTARFTLNDNDNPNRYSIPDKVLNKPAGNPTQRLEMVGFSYNLNPFSFSFADVSDKENVFISTKDQTLVFMDKYIQMDFELSSDKVFGFGERVHEFQLNEGTYTMWASGQDSPYDDGKGRKGLYGVHPFILVQGGKNKDQFYGLFFRSSNMQTPIIRYTDDGKTILSYITIGGQIELYFLLNGSAKTIIQQYHNMIGKPQLPPFWSLGWQQASWKYQSQDMVQDVVDNYAKARMPLDVVYFDIPYLDNYADFTIDTKNFPDVKTFANNLHAKNQRLVVIIDAALSAEDTSSKYYTQGNKDQIFIQSNIKNSAKYGKNLVSKVWPKKAVFIDWLHDKCVDTWKMGLDDLYASLPYDGLWLDMNEATTFANGEIDGDQDVNEQEIEAQSTPKRILNLQTDNDYNWFDILNGDVQSTFDTYHLPFVVKNSEGNAGNYDNMSLSLNATHPGWNDETEFNLHSLYGHMMSWRTNGIMRQQNPDQRPFILTRSTFASTGRFASHWLGDNLREWRYLKYSIAGIMNMNMFGIPHVGADVCGFFGPTRDDNMCSRWIQLATFYPFARVHQNLTYLGKDSDRSEPYLMSEPYKTNAIASIRYRYSFLRMMYTCLFEINQRGGTCFDPLFYHYPNDENVYQNYEQQFIVANSVLVSPVLEYLEDGVTTYKGYMPQGKWVNLANYSEILDAKAGGKVFDLTDKPVVNAYLKQGSLIPFQLDPEQTVMTTADLIGHPISIIAHRDDNGFATGMVFLDQGVSQKELDDQQYEYYQINHQANSIQLTLKQGAFGKQPHVFNKVIIVDASDLSGTNFACAYDTNFNKVNFMPYYNKDTQSVELRSDEETPLKFSNIKVIYYGSTDKGDLNLCDSAAFNYKIADGENPDFTKSSATFALQHLGGSLPPLQATIQFTDQSIVNIKWSWQLDKDGKVPAGKKTPVDVPTDILDTSVKGQPTQKLSDYITVTANPFKVEFNPRNRLDKDPYFSLRGMLFDSFLNFMSVQLKVEAGENFKGIFGLGERANKNFFYEDGVYTIWGKDQGTPDEDGKPPAKSMYGAHPFYMYRHAKDSWVGVFTKLAQAQDWFISNNKDTGMIDIKTIATGGIGDIYVMVDQQEPEDILERYLSIVGDPVLVPQWALGWNQCRWGYHSVKDLQDSVKGYADNKIPLDVQWTDIDYMSDYKDFTYDTNAFKGLPDFIDTLHKQNQRFVPIIDAGVAIRPGSNYAAYDEGIKDDVFLKINNEVFIGKVWPNDAAFPDFFNPKTAPWWQKQLDGMHSQIAFDGLWLDMNEVSNFCDGECYDSQKPPLKLKHQLPYSPAGSDLEDHTASLDAYHSNGFTQLDTHSYWGTQEVKATHDWFTQKKQRTFIIERSSFAGMGKFGSRWLGDNSAKAEHMGYSVTGIMLMNMFGIPLSGVDICGFNDNTNDELCARWHTVGAFYPFSRNHNSWNTIPQEPWAFPGQYRDGTKYIDIMRDAIFTKYSIIRFFYTELLMSSLASKTGYRKAIYKPLFFEYPEDMNTYQDIQYNIILGEALKLSILSDKLLTDEWSFYFPSGVWCNILTPTTKCLTSKGESIKLPTLPNSRNLHLRQGYMVPLQDAKKLDIRTTVDLQKIPVDFHVLPLPSDPSALNWRASGIYANDDGLNLDVTGNWNQYSFSLVGQYSGTAPDITETILLNIVAKVTATNFQSKDDTLCYAVNQNDYLNQIFIYNAGSFKQSDTYTVTATTTDGKDVDAGSAKYDQTTDRIVYTPNTALCLTKYQQLKFVKSA